MRQLGPEKVYPADFGARVFTISRDARGERLTWMKVTGGTLATTIVLRGGEGDAVWEEKADQLRHYSGSKFQLLEAGQPQRRHRQR